MIIKEFEEQVKRSANKIAVETDTRTLTYDELNACANRVANEIIKLHGTSRENREHQIAALLFEHGADMIIGVLGALKAGRIYVPLDITYPENRLVYMLENSQSSVILTNTRNLPLAQRLSGKIKGKKPDLQIINLDTVDEHLSSANISRNPSGEALAYILYTSGSTGLPKGVLQDHGNVLYYIRNWTNFFSITDSDRMTLFSAFSHDGAGQDMFGALLNGATLFPRSIKEEVNINDLPEWLINKRITIWHSVPTLYRYFVTALNNRHYQFDDLRFILLGGEQIREHDVNMFKKYFPNAILANVYGQTESSVDSIWIVKPQDPFNRVLIGKPLDKTELLLVDEDGGIVEDFGSGEIYVACEHIALGYWQDEEKGKDVFLQDEELGRLYRTGDIGKLVSGGDIEILGRKDTQIKVRGFRVELGEIETHLLEYERIRETAVIAKESQDGYRLYAYIAADEQLELAQLREHLAKKLPEYMIPSYFVLVEQMPVTPSGKIDRKSLAALKKEPLKAGATYAAPRTDLEQLLVNLWKDVLNLEDVGIEDNFFDLGGNSFDILKLNNLLASRLKRDIPIVKMFRYPTVESLVKYLYQQENLAESPAPVEGEPGKEKTNGIRPRQNRGDIAVIGMSGRFPGARNIDEFWENLKNGVESISFFTRQELQEAGNAPQLLGQPNFVNAKGMLEDIEYFDSLFFNYSPKEAEIMDPQLRVFHQCVWQALEHAGIDPGDDDRLISIYAGNAPNHHWMARTYFQRRNNPLGEFERGLLNSHFSTRVSYSLNLKGTSVSIRTACSTSLVAVHLACRDLLAGECDIALAGGVSVALPGKTGYLYQEGMIVSADGHNRTFDSRASGTIFGDGAGLVVLKRLEEAVEDRDCIHAVIKGTAVNNDGIRKVGYTAPSISGQAEVIHAAAAAAEVKPESISYIETHGTATPLGDSAEIEALSEVFKKNGKRSYILGSVKTNVGHLNAAAGIAGLIKTVLALEHKQIPPSLNFETPNPMIDFEHSAFCVNTGLLDWKNGDGPLRAGVSSFGLGGTNAHVILEEAPRVNSRMETKDFPLAERPYQLIVLSAKTQTALDKMRKNLAAHFWENPGINLADAAYTLQSGRSAFEYRGMLVCTDANNAAAGLDAANTTAMKTSRVKPGKPNVVFMFPGLGSQYVNMGYELYRTEPVFREETDRCFDILNGLVKEDIKGILYPAQSAARAGDKEMSDTGAPGTEIHGFEIAQMVIFILEYALAKLLMHWGITPRAMIGYSFGEYAAACISGVLSLEDALKLVVSRGKLIAAIPGGAMLSVPLDIDQVSPLLPADLSIAIDNGLSTIVAGTETAIASFEREMKEKRIICMRLPASHALHSRSMEPILSKFASVVETVTVNKPQIPYISNVTGTWLTAEEAAQPAYWASHLRKTVRFADGIKELLNEKRVIFVEIGPGRDLGALIMRYLDNRNQDSDAPSQPVLDLIRPQQKEIADVSYLLQKIGRLWLNGVKIDWRRFHDGANRYHIPLPTYPFDEQRYWTGEDSAGQDKIDPGLWNGVSLPAAPVERFYVPSWKPSASPLANAGTMAGESCWLMFIDESGFTSQLVQQLKDDGRDVSCVKAGTGFTQVTDSLYTVNPGSRDDYDNLLGELKAQGKIPHTIVHLWGITAATEEQELPEPLELKRLEDELDLGIYSLLRLAGAIRRQDYGEGNQVHIKVITDHMQQVPGEEVICPGKAAILAAIKSIPLEYTGIACSSIDIALPRPGSRQEIRLRSQLLAELTQETSHPVVVYRGKHRLVQGYEPVEWNDTGETAGRLKKHGIYLVINGLEGVAFKMAEYLAQTLQPGLVFIENEPIETCGTGDENVRSTASQREESNRAHRLDINLEEEVPMLKGIEEKIEADLQIKGMSRYHGLTAALDELTTCLILDYFRTNGVDSGAGRVYGTNDLKKALNILPKFSRCCDFFIKVLAEDNIIKTNGNSFEFLSSAAAVRNPVAFLNEALETYPQFSGTLRLMEYCSRHFSKALSGQIEAISVLYPEGNYIRVQDQYRDPVESSNTRLYLSLLQRFILDLLAKSPRGKTIRILEVGGGKGILTGHIIPGLKAHKHKVEYHFTDIGMFFVINAEKEAKQQGYDFMKFGRLDISTDPAAQGYDPGSFDIILAMNVVHAVKRVEAAVGHLKRLLVPGGIMCLIELVNPGRLSNMIDGLAEAWWYFEDTHIRQDSPLLRLPHWQDLLEKQAFRHVCCFPADKQKQAETDCGLIIAQQEADIHHLHDHIDKTGDIGNKAQYLKRLEELGANVGVFATNVADLQQMSDFITRIEATWGKFNGVIYNVDHAGNQYAEDTDITRQRSPEPPDEFMTGLLAARLKEAVVLDKLFKSENLDFFVFCSAFDSISPVPGKIENSAVNMCFDALAHYKSSREDGFIASINWASDPEPGAGQGSANVFSRLLGHWFPRVLVTCRDLEHLSRQDQEQRDELHRSSIQESPGAAGLSSADYQRSGLSGPYEPPTNKIQQVLVEIWQEFLGVEHVGISDDFFELGTDSLVFITIAAKIHKALHVNIPINEFFNRPTVKELAEIIARARQEIYSAIEPVEKKEYYEVSSTQRRLYFLHHMELNSTSYNIPMVKVLEGNVDKERFEEAFGQLIRRHESLRTSFAFRGEEIVQHIQDRVNFSVAYDEMPEDQAREVVDHGLKPYDLSRAPLFRVGLIKVHRRHHILMVDMHHIISDGTSLDILIKEFLDIYAGEELPRLRLQYKDFALWQNKRFAAGKKEEQEKYWLDVFNGEIPALNLPVDYPRPAVMDFAGDRITFTIEKDELPALKTLLTGERVTMFMVMLTAYNILLARLSSQEDIVVGTPTAGRRHHDLEHIMGMFVNTLALRNYPGSHKTVLEFLREVKASTFDAFENQDYQFEDLVEQVVSRRDVSRNPLFDAMLIFQNYEGGMQDSHERKIAELCPQPYPFEWKRTKFDLTLSARETEKQLLFILEYSTSLFKKETIARYTGYFKRILASMLSGTRQPISQLDMLNADEKRRLLVEFNATDTDFPREKTVKQLFEEQVEQNPHRIALTGVHPGAVSAGTSQGDNGQPLMAADSRKSTVQVTYRELNRRSNHLAQRFAAQGVTPGTIMGIMVERTLEMLEGIIAISKAGATYLPLDPDYPRERLAYILEDSGAAMIVTGKGFTGIDGNGYDIVEIHDRQLSPHPVPNPETACPADSLVYILYTSGSTGKPKGVMIRHDSLVNFIIGITNIIDFGPADRILSLTTFSFDIFGLETLLPLTRGANVIIGTRQEQLSPKAAARAMSEKDVTILQVTPSRLSILLTDGATAAPLKRLNYLLVGGEALPGPLLEKIREIREGKIYNLYGPTETTIWSTMKEVSRGQALNIGTPIANTRIYILSKSGTLQPLGVAGELCIAGAGLARGYVNNEELTRQKFVPDPFHKGRLMYRTGDIARWLPDGNIDFWGRMDSQVKIRGFRVELEEIENQLLAHDDIKEAVVIARENKDRGQFLAAYVVSGEELEVSELRQFLSRELPDYMIPSYFVRMEKIPLTPNGKVNRKALPEPDEHVNVKTGADYTAPTNRLEKTMVGIWQEVLHVDRVGIDDNIFELGGTSIDIIRLSNRYKETFGEEIPVVTMFRYATISSLVKYLENSVAAVREREETLDRGKISKKQILQRRKQMSTGLMD